VSIVGGNLCAEVLASVYFYVQTTDSVIPRRFALDIKKVGRGENRVYNQTATCTICHVARARCNKFAAEEDEV
jgi:CxxC motif-containing protein (DUF1111 family)